MRPIPMLLIVLGCFFSCLPMASASDSARATGPHIEVELVSELDSVQPGSTQWLGVFLQPEPEWHTYWRNPGDSGEPPTIDWQTSAALEFGEIHWPLPQQIPIAHLVNYGYNGDNLLMVPVEVPAELSSPVTVTAELSWLVCKEDCIPGWATLTMTLPVSDSPDHSRHAELFRATRARLPEQQALQGNFEATDSHLVFAVPPHSGSNWHLFPLAGDVINHAADQQSLLTDGKLTLTVPRSDYFSQRNALTALLSNGEQGFYVDFSLNATESQQVSVASPQVLVMLVMAFVGGLILNVMPCVLPVLSMKALALQNHSPTRLNKLAYLFGVLFCFNLFALLVILLRSGGQSIGWGFHMQEPLVVSTLAFLFVFIALVLLDAVSIGGRLAGAGQSLVSGQSTPSHFFTGMLAVIVASPCTAPFMAASMGVAMVSPPLTTLVLFNALALGFALPVTVFFVSPKAAAMLPRPGPWMETFKRLLAFAMLLTVAWLLWVYLGQAGSMAQFGLMIALVLFALACWLAPQLGRSGHAVMAVLALFCVISPAYVSQSPVLPDKSADNSVAFNPATLQALKADNQVVLVNMTADWCITCKVNEQVAFKDSKVASALSNANVTYMVGDWTNKDDEILAFLNRYQRSGVPLYVVFAGKSGEQVLPQILTPDIVVNAIQLAQKETNDER